MVFSLPEQLDAVIWQCIPFVRFFSMFNDYVSIHDTPDTYSSLHVSMNATVTPVP